MTTEKINGNSFDIGNFSNNDKTEGEFLHLVHPVNGEPLYADDGSEIGIHLLGRDSKAFRDANREITNRRLNRKGGMSLTAERIEVEASEVLIKCTVSWDNIVLNKKKLECTPSNIKTIYESASWIKEQVDDFISERANYLGK